MPLYWLCRDFQLLLTWDEKMILKKLNPPSLSSSFLGWDRCQKSPHKFSKSGHWRILRKLHFSIFLPFFTKKRWNGWSKSIVLENKVAINFDFRSGAKKSGHLDYPLQSYGPKFDSTVFFVKFDPTSTSHNSGF